MFIRVKSTPNSPRRSVQICESFREKGRVRQKIVRHVGIAQDEDHVEQLRKLARVLITQIREEREGPFLFDTPENPIADGCEGGVKPKASKKETPEELKETLNKVDIENLREEKRVVEGFHETFGKLFDELGFSSLLTKKKNEVLKDVVLARIARPCSKLHTQVVLAADFGRDILLDRIYRMLDSLEEVKEKVQKQVLAATERFCLEPVNVLLFDVTTLYFESVEVDELRGFGYSKDQKFHSVQVVLALATTQNGLPVGYRLFPGNTAEVSTLLAALEEWKKILPIEKTIFVADRAMMSEKNLQALEEAEVNYVIAAKLRKLTSEIQGEILSSKTLESRVCLDRTLKNNRRLIVSYDSERSKKDKKDRVRLIEKMMKKIGRGKNAKKLISNRGYQKYLRVEGESKLQLDEEKIAGEERWDGLHGIISNMLSCEAKELLSRYRNLWVIEESFRIQKHDLRVRPVYHFKPRRIEGHLLVCYLAFALVRHMQLRVDLQQERISAAVMRDALWRVQSSFIRDEETGARYRLPSPLKGKAKQIYQALGIKRSLTPHRL